MKKKKFIYNYSFVWIKKKFYKLKIFFLEILFMMFFFLKSNQIKIALCTMGKKENLYVNEFINYYKKLGVNKIFIYDDNEPNSERIKDVITLDKSVIVYENIKDRIKNQGDAFTECYNNNKDNYDWFLMFDLDEYLIIVNNTLKKYLTDPIFNRCDFIKIHWLIPSDNNLVHYDNRTLLERFKGPYINSFHIKSIIRGHINNLKYWVHSPSYSPQRNITCNNAGEEIKYKKNMNFQSVKPFNKKKSYIIHFLFKSTEEYINKYKRGYSNWFYNDLNNWVLNYLKNNKITKEKIEYFEKEFKINLSKFKKNLK